MYLVFFCSEHPDTAVGVFESIDNGWSAGGLKIHVLDEKERLRILYNGLLERVTDKVIQHCKFSFMLVVLHIHMIRCSSLRVVRTDSTGYDTRTFFRFLAIS